MFSNTGTLDRADSYERAHKHFTQTDLPGKPGSVLRKGWADNERPLGTGAQHHYRIEQRYGGEWYDVILYSTTMARFYAPNSAGETRVCYNWDDRNTSAAFMHHVVRVTQSHQRRDTEGIDRYVPIGSERSFSTDLLFDMDGALMVKCSTHAPIVSVHAGKELAQWKAQLKHKMDPVICLMEISVQDTLAAGIGTGQFGSGWAFTSVPTHSDVDHSMRRWVEADCPDLNEKGYETMRELYRTCAEYIIDRRLHSAAPTARWSTKKEVPYTQPKASAVTTSVLNYLAKYAPRSVKRNDNRPLPQFPTELPAKWVFA